MKLLQTGALCCFLRVVYSFPSPDTIATNVTVTNVTASNVTDTNMTVTSVTTTNSDNMDVPECTVDTDCPLDRACYQDECVDPCLYSHKNTNCKPSNHFPVSSCSHGFTGNPYVGCEPIMILRCKDDSDCPLDKRCTSAHKCVDPCIFAWFVCGLNTDCDVTDHRWDCRCRSGYSLQAGVCSKIKHGKTSNSSTTSHEAEKIPIKTELPI